ncbi:MAG: YhjD/YihY/BrkB family envelope integrity protein [Candidatus Binatus sp.]|uniref:YhjD/YihY/BrkB family envelope integrity protein n=1 Tax=Candidatus Binatus sp. TaxID=2811406 RepID=UPI0027220BAD|nr:YhjD/YihY/BrkB family envelope integrity protein [Candidatus Binatus sp.]MDO8434062.1 YhjD/YihY/BrkB family envelope integrity protein [Candidatus Binatus sp.]
MANQLPTDLDGAPPSAKSRTRSSYALTVWRILSRAVEAFINNNDLLRASALTYTVALSIVPVLALAFSALKGFGGSERLRPLVDQYLALGSSGVSAQLMMYIENVNAAALGSAGGAFLLITVISTMSTVEQALNTIFNVPQSRSYFRKFSDYLSVLFTVPLLIVAALGVTALLSERIAQFPIVTLIAPYLFVWSGFFFLFVFFPYTRVKYGPALIGSFVTAILFQLAQWGYVRFQVGVASYRAIYGALASLPIFLVWIYVAWAVVLFGAELTAAIQRGDIPTTIGPMSADFPYIATLQILLRLSDRALKSGQVIKTETLAREMNVAEPAIVRIVAGLMEGGFIIRADPGSPSHSQGLFLARDPSAIVLADAIDAVMAPAQGVEDARIAMVLEKLGEARHGALKSITLAELRSPASSTAHRVEAEEKILASVVKDPRR